LSDSEYQYVAGVADTFYLNNIRNKNMN